VISVAKLTIEALDLEVLSKQLQDYAPEYDLDVSLVVVNHEMWYRAYLFPNELDREIKVSEIEEVYGATVEEFRLNFFVKLADLRKQTIDKIGKK
jgi:hypothetical protein